MFLTLVAALVVATPSDGLPVKAPRAVGMSATRLEAIDRIVNRGIRAGGYPGAAVVVGRKGAAVWQKGFGRLGWSRESPAVSADRSIYDLASLSKVIGTTTAAMLLYDEGRLVLDAPVASYLPAFSGGLKDSVTIRQLLTHRSGLPAGRDLWRLARNAQEARLAVIDTPLECAPGRCFVYSDLGYDVLGMVVETIAGQGLDQFLHERVFQPLGMNETFYRPADSVLKRVAPTENTPPRGYPLRGEVHDENAYALGGIAGHAGLFSTAADLSVFAQMMLNGGEYDGVRIASDSAVALFTHRAAGTRALGWDTADGDGGAGRYLSERAYGHTGYTGTSIWIDPDREMFVVLLTNRVHAARARRPAKVISDVRADLSDAAALAVLDAPDGVLAMPASFRADRMSGWNRNERLARSRRAGGRASSARSRAAAAARLRAARRAGGKSVKAAASSRSRASSKASSRAKAASKAKAAAGARASSKARPGSAKAAKARTVTKPSAHKTAVTKAKPRAASGPAHRPSAKKAQAAKGSRA